MVSQVITHKIIFKCLADSFGIADIHKLVIIFKGKYLSQKERNKVNQILSQSIISRSHSVSEIVSYWKNIFTDAYMDQWVDVYRSVSYLPSKNDDLIENDLNRTFNDRHLDKSSIFY